MKGYVHEDLVCLSKGASVILCSESCTSEIEFGKKSIAGQLNHTPLMN